MRGLEQHPKSLLVLKFEVHSIYSSKDIYTYLGQTDLLVKGEDEQNALVIPPSWSLQRVCSQLVSKLTTSISHKRLRTANYRRPLLTMSLHVSHAYFDSISWRPCSLSHHPLIMLANTSLNSMYNSPLTFLHLMAHLTQLILLWKSGFLFMS